MRGLGRSEQQSASFLWGGTVEQASQNDQQPLIRDQGDWRLGGHPDTLWALSRAVAYSSSMIDTSANPADTSTSAESGPSLSDPIGAAGNGVGDAETAGVHFTERYSEILGKVNQTLDQLDWDQMGRIGKSIGILVVVIVAQVLIKGVLDTINLLPIVPGLLELLGLVVVGQWSWKNLTTGEKRSAVVSRLQHLRQEYLG
jgi:hypothetical protein